MARPKGMTTTPTTTNPPSPALRGVTVVGRAMAGCIAPWLLLAPAPPPHRQEEVR